MKLYTKAPLSFCPGADVYKLCELKLYPLRLVEHTDLRAFGQA